MQLYLVNESTVISQLDAWRYAWAVDYQLYYHYGRSGFRSDARCSYHPGAGAPIPAGAAILHVLDSLDQQGALGYHDEDGNEVPFARVGVKVTQAEGAQVSEVCSHEAIELVTDPHANLTAPNGDLSKVFAYEPGDACQGNAYDVGAPEGRTTGVVVADFCLPGWFDPRTPAGVKTTFRGSLQGPFSLSPHGYVAYVDLANPGAGWQQQLGAERKIPVVDDRLDRRTIAA